MADTKRLGDVIRDARVAAGRGLRDLARELNITPSYLSDIENDRRVPADEVMKRIATLLKLDFDELMAIAGRIGEDAERFLRRNPEVGKLFRKISEKNLSESDLRKVSKTVDELGRKKAGDL
jgi:transcriptional regulator with XRE-family HTH domain